MHHLSREERRASARPGMVLLFKQCSLQKHDTRAEWKAKIHCRWCDKGQKEHCWKVEGCIERGCLPSGGHVWLYLDAKTYKICSYSINHIYLKLFSLFVLCHEWNVHNKFNNIKVVFMCFWSSLTCGFHNIFNHVLHHMPSYIPADRSRVCRSGFSLLCLGLYSIS